VHALYIAVILASWLIALIWTRVILTALYHLPRIPNLLDPRYDSIEILTPNQSAPQITVVVPARNEAASIEATLRSLLAQTIPIEIFAVDDRSTDSTGAIMDHLASETLPAGKLLSVIHIDTLPEGWMGKTHAMALAARQSATEWLLFTDGDILFRPDTLERALRFAHESQADRFTVLSFRPWKVPDPAAKHDSVGVGGFNLIRSSVYQPIGGFEALRLEVLEDLRLGFEVKRQGFRQRVAFGRDMIRVHWATGALGMAHNLTKNFFAVFRFRPAALIAGAVVFSLLFFLPIAGLFAPWPIRSASLVSLTMIAALHAYSARHFTGISMLYLLTLPIGAALLVYALLRSLIVTLVRQGVVWRGTFYPLRELRRHAGPLR